MDARHQPTVDAMTRRYRRHTGTVLVLVAWWGFGNLYEAIVVLPWLWRLPPGSLPAEFELGSPVFYFVPAGVALLTLTWTLVFRVYRALIGGRRAVLLAAVLITVAAAGTGLLVSTVNPTFRDPLASAASVHTSVLMWEAGNVARLALAAAAAITLYRWHASASTPGRQVALTRN